MRDSFILYASHEEMFKMLNATDGYNLLLAIFAFNRDEDISSSLKPLAKMAYVSITNQIKLNNAKYDRRCETSRQNGQLGGAPKGNQNARKEKPSETQNNPNQPKTTQEQPGLIENNLNQPNQPSGYLGYNEQNNLNQPKNNLINLNNPNDNDNDNDNDLLVNNKNNIYNTACAHACVSKNPYLQKCFKTFFSEVFDYCVTDKFLIPANEIIDVMVEAYQQAQAPNGFKFNHTTYNATALLDVFVKIDAYNFKSIINQLVFNESIENRTLYIVGCLIMASQDNKCANTPEQIEVLRKALTSMPHTIDTVNQQTQPTPETTAGD